MVTKANDIWEFLELPARYASKTQALYSWSRNCDKAGNPFLVFLDLIGWAAEHFGTAQAEENSSYGYTELGALADALNEYADSPHEVNAWIDELMTMKGV